MSDTRQQTLEEAFKLGVPQENIVPVGKSIPEFLQERGLEDSIDIVADFVGMKQTFADAQSIGKLYVFNIVTDQPFLALIWTTVRYGGKILYVGTLSNETVVDAKVCIKKRLSVLFNYGSKYEDVVEILDLISKGIVRPYVETGNLIDFPKVLQDLHDGKSRVEWPYYPVILARRETTIDL